MPADSKQQTANSRQRPDRQPRLLPTGSRGQSILEYAVFTAAVSAALIAMNVYVRRAVQANLKNLEQQINADVPP